MSDIHEIGPWRARAEPRPRRDYSKRVFVESDDFTHDVRLYVDGDFADDAQRLRYAEEIARRLNGWQAQQPVLAADHSADAKTSP